MSLGYLCPHVSDENGHRKRSFSKGSPEWKFSLTCRFACEFSCGQMITEI